MPFLLARIPALGLGFLLSLPCVLPAAAQDSLVKPISKLRMLTRNSGYIFDGTVLSVERLAETEPGSVATVQISFRVEQAIRGTRNGQVLKIREWAGLWSSGERYRPGERLLLFLYNPSKLGLTSPVEGPLGRLAVDCGGNFVLEDARLDALPLEPASKMQVGGKNRGNTRALALAIQRGGVE